MKFKIIVCFLLFLSGTSLLQAQYVIGEDSGDVSNPVLSKQIKVFPSQLITHFPTYMASFSHSIKQKYALEYGLGVVFDGNYYDVDDEIYYFNKRGFKTAVTWQIPLTYRNGVSTYLGVQPFYNNVKFNRTRTYELSCGEFCSYFSERTYTITREETGLRFVYGVLLPLSDALSFEFAAGIGSQIRKFTPDERRPQDFIREYGETGLQEHARFAQFAADLSFKIAYRIGK